MSESSIILFDGHCNLCNRWVDFVIKRDPHHKFKFAAQQSESGQRILKEKGFTSTTVSNTIIIISEGTIFYQSTAVLKIISQLKSPLKHFYFLRFVPRVIRDFVYGIIAKNRYRIFGKRPVCRVPNSSEQGRFIN